MQMNLHWHVSGGGAGRTWTHGHDGRNRRCKPPGLHGRGVNRISGIAEYRKAESNANEFDMQKTEFAGASIRVVFLYNILYFNKLQTLDIQ